MRRAPLPLSPNSTTQSKVQPPLASQPTNPISHQQQHHPSTIIIARPPPPPVKLSYAATLKTQPEPFKVSFSHAFLLPIISSQPPPSFDPSLNAFISLDHEEVESLPVKWINMLINKVVGKSFSVKYLKSSLQRIWKIQPQIQFIALGKGFYNVTLPTEADRENVLSNGPWFISSFMLLVQPWVPGFKPSQATISKVPVWVSLSEFPIEFHSNSVFTEDCR